MTTAEFGKKQTQKPGRSWDSFGPHSSYKEAQKKMLLKIKESDDTLEGKVKFLDDGYFVKVRVKESVLLDQAKAVEDAKKRKKDKAATK